MTDLEFILRLAAYFLIGGLLDILATMDVIAVQQRKAFRSAFVSFITTVISYVVFYYIMNSPQFLAEILIYSLGGSVGAYYIIKSKYQR